ncbi:MAG: nucleotide exchange factor GrpE, partial [Deinococcota bacterium]
MSQDEQKNDQEQATQDTQAAHPEQTAETESTESSSTAEGESADFNFPGLDENMLGQVQEMMARLERAEALEKENADLKSKLGRLAADFESYRRRTQEDVQTAEGQGIAKAAESLMPIYDDLDRALSMGSGDPAKLIPGMQAVQAAV